MMTTYGEKNVTLFILPRETSMSIQDHLGFAIDFSDRKMIAW